MTTVENTLYTIDNNLSAVTKQIFKPFAVVSDDATVIYTTLAAASAATGLAFTTPKETKITFDPYFPGGLTKYYHNAVTDNKSYTLASFLEGEGIYNELLTEITTQATVIDADITYVAVVILDMEIKISALWNGTAVVTNKTIEVIAEVYFSKTIL